MSTEQHPARLASQRSMDAVHAKDKEAWIANFTDDAVIEDPIGVSPLDPTGEGHRGIDATRAFWDNQIAPSRIVFNIRESYACGNECANVGTITIMMDGGLTTLVDGVFTYYVNDEGLVTALRAYWEVDAMKIFA